MYRLFLPLLCAVAFFGCGQVTEQPPVAPEPPADPRAASSDGLPIAFTVTGDEPLAVVLIHGWMCDQSYWDAQVPFLSKNYTVVTVDLGGHGESGMSREGWPLAAYAEDVKTVVDQLEPGPVILVGHSMGGPVALEAARLIGDRVLGVIGVDTFQNVEAKFDPEQTAPFLAALDSDFPTACSGFVRDMFTHDSDPSLVDRVVNDMCGGPSEVGTALLRQFIDADVSRLLADTSVPVRSINSDLWPTDIAVNQKFSAGYDAVIIEGTGHFLMMEKPDVFNDALADVLLEIAHSSM